MGGLILHCLIGHYKDSGFFLSEKRAIVFWQRNDFLKDPPGCCIEKETKGRMGKVEVGDYL